MISKAAVGVGTAAVQPVLWTFLGYQFEAASMIAGLFACLMVRVWVSLSASSRQGWALDVAVTGIALLFTAGWVAMQRPVPFFALMSGTGFGALGAGIIAIALKWVKRGEAMALGGDDGAPRPKPAPEDSAQIAALMEVLKGMKLPDDRDH